MPVQGIGSNPARRSRLDALLNSAPAPADEDAAEPALQAPSEPVDSAAPTEPPPLAPAPPVSAPAENDDPVDEVPVETAEDAALMDESIADNKEQNAALEALLASLATDPRLRTPMMKPIGKPNKGQLNNGIVPELAERIRRHGARKNESIVSVVERSLDVMMDVSEAAAGITVKPSPLLFGQPTPPVGDNVRLAGVLSELASDPRLYPPEMKRVESDITEQFSHRILLSNKVRLKDHVRRTGETMYSTLNRALCISMDVAEAEAGVDAAGEPLTA